MTLIKDILRSMDYGPAPESADHVRVWLAARESFGHFIAGRFVKGKQHFDVFNPATGETIARVAQGSFDRFKYTRQPEMQNLVEDLLLGVEIVVDAACLDLGHCRDLTQRRRGVTLTAKQLGSSS